jgi:GT2 family glycosyltransferase
MEGKIVSDRYGADTDITGRVVSGHVIRQAFVAKGFLKSVLVSLATFRRKNTCLLDFEIVDKFNQKIASKTVNTKNVLDNRYHEVKFNVDLEVGRQYEFRIHTVNGTFNNSVCGKWGRQRHGSGHFYIGSRRVLGELSCVFQFVVPWVNELRRAGEDVKLDANLLQTFLKTDNRKLSIIILNKDQPDMLQECIARIIKHTKYEPYEIVIGDTGSTDPRTLEFYEHLPPRCKVVRGLEYHFGKNNNELVQQYTDGFFLLFMNNDIYLDEDSITKAIRYLMCYKIGSVGIRLVKKHGTIDHDGQLLFQHHEVCVPDHVNVNRVANQTPDDNAFVDGNTGAFMMTRRDLWESIGGFDERYDDIYQDCDYMLELGKRGFRNFCVRKTKALHLVSATRGKMASTHNKTDIELYRDKWEEAGRAISVRNSKHSVMAFVTCVNKDRMYMNMLSSLPVEILPCIELLPVRNNDNYFTVTEALNLGHELVEADHIVYCHQDVMYGDNWYMDMCHALAGLGSRLGVVGFEGLGHQGDPRGRKLISTRHTIEVQTVDEFCFIVRGEADLWFNEDQKFHYYAVDLCLQAIENGLYNYVVGTTIDHLSGGAKNILAHPQAFKKEAECFWKRWHKRFPKVYTTTTNFTPSGIMYLICADALNN